MKGVTVIENRDWFPVLQVEADACVGRNNRGIHILLESNFDGIGDGKGVSRYP